MNENDNNFEALRRLLAFKNRETPPPGYFNEFSSRVIARIRAGETEESAGGWVAKLFQALDLRPAFAGTFAAALCMILVFGIVYAERPDTAPQPLWQEATPSSTPIAMAPTELVPPTETPFVASTNPVMNLDSFATLMNSPNQLMQPVSFQIPGN
ncbi:MAG TPA: hypothetical protein VMD27_12350 [Candidatus Aquilonibacter sp.]|nr:hypothetical protein [Candidatus Aquilonibacter sp.]